VGVYQCFEGIVVSQNTDNHPPSDISRSKRLECPVIIYFYLIHRTFKETNILIRGGTISNA